MEAAARALAAARDSVHTNILGVAIAASGPLARRGKSLCTAGAFVRDFTWLQVGAGDDA